MSLDQKKEIIVDCYSAVFDKELAYKKAQATIEERTLLEADEEFQARLEFFLIEEREALIERIRGCMHAENESVRYKAIMDMAKILFPEYVQPIHDEEENKPQEVVIRVEYV